MEERKRNNKTTGRGGLGEGENRFTVFVFTLGMSVKYSLFPIKDTTTLHLAAVQKSVPATLEQETIPRSRNHE